jgi:conjugative relaxase-like TrwC/TraI family protein
MLALSKPLSWIEAWRYYREELQNARLNYYLPIVSSWHGQLARNWGLDKTVTEDTFAAVAAGRGPRTGPVLVDDLRSNTDIPRAIAHCAGWDATVSAPISVSLTALVGGDLRIHDAHCANVRTCLYELERFTQARISGNPRRRPPVAGLRRCSSTTARDRRRTTTPHLSSILMSWCSTSRRIPQARRAR